MLYPDSIADGFFVQVVITKPQAELLVALTTAAEMNKKLDNTVREQSGLLATFFTDVAANPKGYPVSGKYARSIKTRKRMLKRAMRRAA
jgi:hypothetical protein